MHLIDTITWVDKVRITGEVKATLRANGPYFSSQGFEKHWLIEMCAQASAALYQASRRGIDAASPNGYLISIRQFTTVSEIELRPEDELLFHIAFEVESAPLGQSRCLTTACGKVIAEGELTFLLDG